MAIRNMVGRRLMSDADLESFNSFEDGFSGFTPEPVQPAVAAPQPTPVAEAVPSSNAVPTLEEILAVGPGNYLNVGGTIYQPVFQESGSGENLTYGGPVGIMTYRLGAGPGEAYNYTDLSTGATQRNEFTESGGFFGDLFSDVKSVAQDVAPIAAAALTMGGAGGLLGSALSGGALSGTAASALGNALISGGAGALTGQDPLKAALLAGGLTYGGSLLGDFLGGAEAASGSTLTDAQFIAADAAQLASQGIGADQIEQILRASGVNTATAIAAADAATSGMNVAQIAQDITLGNRGLFTDTATTATPATVTTDPIGLQTVTTTAAAPVANISDIVAAIPAAVLPQAATPMVDLPPLEPTGLMAPEPPQVVEVAGTQQQAPVDNALAAVAPMATVVSPPATTSPNEVIEVTGTAPKQQTIGDVAAAINAGTLYGPGMTGTQTTVYDKVLEATDSKTAADTAASAAGLLGGLSLADILKALTSLSSLGMLGGGGGGGGGGTQQSSFVSPTASVPMGNADYYNAVQQYYNTFMPQTPRDVATPLQQWYEGKFGG